MNYWIRPAIKYEKPTIEVIISKVCNYFNVPREVIFQKKRVRDVNEARSIIMYLLHKYLEMTSTEVGRILKKDHATVLHACKKIDGFMDIDSNYKELVNSFKTIK